jgi:hypothetical protein
LYFSWVLDFVGWSVRMESGRMESVRMESVSMEREVGYEVSRVLRMMRMRT